MNNMSMWPELTNPLIAPPVVKEKPDRTRMLRRKKTGESKVSSKLPKTEVTMKFSVFHVKGHNKIGFHFLRIDGVGSTNEEHRATPISNVAEPSGSRKGGTRPKYQRRLNPLMQEVVKKEITKWLDVGVVYPITDCKWVSPVQCVPKKRGITVVRNEKGLARGEWYCLLDGYSEYNQIYMAPENEEKTTFTCPYVTYTFERMPFGLCNAPTTFQRCMLSIFTAMVEDSMKVVMDVFLVVVIHLKHIWNILQRCVETNLVLNWDKCHFMVKEGIILGNKISGEGMQVDQAKVEVIAKQPPPISVKGVQKFLGHTCFYRVFIKDFSKVAYSLCKLLEKESTFNFDEIFLKSFLCLKEKQVSALIILTPYWSILFKLMCGTSGVVLRVVLGQRNGKLFHLVYYASLPGSPKAIALPRDRLESHSRKFGQTFCKFRHATFHSAAYRMVQRLWKLLSDWA
ncbi:hypothetical protein MTR67_038934 [Solanum verrucosum]|uniref:Reverse transcriptase domain-containing protein n=1 Tax=Solanum verrucosum TaxID=315347 RepID=A0AAF0UGR3_SOLVR|nr:hypothetical protein MTR67_038934 [Solanum verrucosum]